MNPLTKRVWKRLSAVRSLSFVARSSAAEKAGWSGQADGKVDLQQRSTGCIHFVEFGSYATPGGTRLKFSNIYRWTLRDSGIRLETLRFGPEKPVHLVDLIPDVGNRMISERPHACAKDLYSAFLELGRDLRFNWSVTGPHKSEIIDCLYSPEELERTVG